MLRKRLLSALVLLLPVVAATWWGGPWFFALLALAALLGAWEFYRMPSSGKAQPLTYLGILGVLLLLATQLMLPPPPLVVSGAVIIPMLWLITRPYSERAFFRWMWLLGGIIYLGWTLGYFLPLREMEGGREWVFLTLFATFASDSAAFLCGRAWGRRPLAPAISPSKTWEGAIAGFLAALGVSLFLAFLLRLPLSYAEALLLGGLISLAAQTGDLVESRLKRNMGVKDSGKLIPGHGGVLDRLDSLIFTGIVVYYYVLWAT